jgi:hypothetical protein
VAEVLNIQEFDTFPFYADDGSRPMLPLHVAIRRGDLAEVMERMEFYCGGTPCEETMWWPLHMCVLAPPHPDRYRILEEILWRTICTHNTDTQGRTALDIAIEMNDTQAVDILMRGGADPQIITDLIDEQNACWNESAE